MASFYQRRQHVSNNASWICCRCFCPSESWIVDAISGGGHFSFYQCCHCAFLTKVPRRDLRIIFQHRRTPRFWGRRGKIANQPRFRKRRNPTTARCRGTYTHWRPRSSTGTFYCRDQPSQTCHRLSPRSHIPSTRKRGTAITGFRRKHQWLIISSRFSTSSRWANKQLATIFSKNTATG